MSYKIFFSLPCFFVVLLSIGCVNVSKPDAKDLSIHFSDPNSIRFQGKGSGAGFMLTGAMGPMGIAIGIAIDEGIAKDIQEAANSQSFDIDYLIRNSFVESQFICGVKAIDVNHYGFKLLSGSDDLVEADISSRIYFFHSDPIDIINPLKIDGEVSGARSVSLAELKLNPELIEAVLSDSFKQLFEGVCQ